ncbi:hypothetical protein MPLB_430067 [Mesorhizobium sp. ORS 3324]|nr:hypothetical protein MPLB_430067 [Mesorhizobium sp. ORS 3324]
MRLRHLPDDTHYLASRGIGSVDMATLDSPLGAIALRRDAN